MKRNICFFYTIVAKGLCVLLVCIKEINETETRAEQKSQ